MPQPYIPKNLKPGIFVEKRRYVVVRLRHNQHPEFYARVGRVDEPTVFMDAERICENKRKEWRGDRHGLEVLARSIVIERAGDIYWENHLKKLVNPNGYLRHLNLFMAHVAHRHVETITTLDVESHVAILQKRGIKKSTVNRHLATISGLFTKLDEWQERREIADLAGVNLPRRNPCKYIERESEKDLVRKVVLTPDQFSAFMMCATIRLRRCLLAAVHSILRPGDLRALSKARHIDRGNNIFSGLQRKSGRPFAPPITPAMWELINTAPGDKILDFKNHEKEFKAARRRAGMSHLQFRDLRRTGARMMLKNGTDIASVQQYLGHGDLNTTQRYVGAANEDLQEAGKILQDLYKWPSVQEPSPCTNCNRVRPETRMNTLGLCDFCESGYRRQGKFSGKIVSKLSANEIVTNSEGIAKCIDYQENRPICHSQKSTLAQQTLNPLV